MEPRTLRLGKNPPVLDLRTLRFFRYERADLPAPPVAVDWSKGVGDWPMYLNDRYGDCTCAAVGHMIEAWTASAQQPRKLTDAAILELYEHFTPPGPENGCNMLDVLKYWRHHGVGTDRIRGFALLTRRSITEPKLAISIFGCCYIGVALPKFAVDAPDISKVPWEYDPYEPGPEEAPAPDGGHCVNAVGYDARNLYVVTWGAIKAMSWLFYQQYCDEAYAVLSEDFLAKGKTPAGLDLAQLQADISRIDERRAA